MIRFLTLFLVIASVLAWDPHLKIAEKIAIPHHIRHNYEYTDFNMRDITRRLNQNVRQGFSQLSGPPAQPLRQSQPAQPSGGFQSQPFQSSPGFQRQPSSGFQSPAFDQSREFRNSPSRNTRFFNLNVNNRPDFGSGRSESFFNRRS